MIQLQDMHPSDLPEQSLSAATPDHLTPPPNTPVTYTYNPYYTTDCITNSSPTLSAFTPGTYPAAATLTLPGFSAYSAAANIGKLTHTFPMATVPLMHISPVPGTAEGIGGSVSSTPYTRVSCCPPYPSAGVPIYPSPLSSFTTMPRSFPIVPAGTATLFSPSSPYYSQDGGSTLQTGGHGMGASGLAGVPSYSSMIGFGGPGSSSGAGFTNGTDGRPPYSFSALIAMAILSSPKKMRTLPEIYDFIAEKFSFYQRGDKKWKNSVRHNLSLNKCFKKAPRKDGELMKGKGNYWVIDPNCDHILENGSFRSPSKRRRKKENGLQVESCPEGGSLGGDLEEEMDEEGSGSETKAILNPNTSAAEILIPSIDNSQGSGGEASSQQNHHSDFGVDKLIAK